MSDDRRNDIKKHLSDNTELSDINCSDVLEAISETAIVSITDSKGRIIEVNDTFCEISGYTREELIGKDHRLLNSRTHPKEFFKDIWQTILSGKPWKGEIQNRKKNGEPYWVLSSISPIFNTDGTIDKFISIRFDVTEKYKHQNMLIHFAKTSVLGEMAAGIAHEINNPLAIILGRTALLKGKVSKPEINAQDCLNDISKIEFVGNRILKIVKGIKSFVKKTENDPMENINTIHIIDSVVELASSLTKKKNVNLKIGNIEDSEVACRPAQIEQVLLCLISNACDAIHEKEKPWIQLDVEVCNGITYFKVTDCGDGIPEKVAEKLMQPFFTTKGDGTGLGLSIAKTIIEEHKGKLFYNNKCSNTQFVIELPVIEADTGENSGSDAA